MLKYRPVTDADREKLAEEIGLDPDHKEKCNPDFWLKPEAGVRLFAVQDEEGDVLFIRAENVLRLHIQACSLTGRKRITKVIDECLSDMAANSKQNYRQLIFEGVFKPLIRFLNKRGFHASQNEHVYDL